MAEGRRLADFLASLARRKWEWGKTDCLMILADWFIVKRGFDPVAGWRGTYSTERECLAILQREGGIVALVDKVCQGICERTDTPKAGDIAVVLAPWKAGAICVNETERAVLTVDKGLVIARNEILPLVAAWKV